MVDVTEVVSEGEGFFERLKNACLGVVVGVVLFLGSFVVLFVNEGMYVSEQKRIAEAGEVLEGRSTKAEELKAEWEGKLVHVTGTAKTDEVLKDEQFGLQVNALRLERSAEMYQWTETKKTRKEKKKKITTYTYEKKWVDEVVPISSFEGPEKAKYDNPDSMTYSSLRVVASDVDYGAFALAPEQTARLGTLQPLAVKGGATPVAATPASPADSGTAPVAAATNACPECGKQLKSAQGVADHMKAKHPGSSAPAATSGTPAASPAAGALRPLPNGFYKGADPNTPQVGDEKITFEYAPPTAEVSFIAQQVGNRLQTMVLPSGKEFIQQRPGIHTAAAIFTMMQDEATLLLWILRGVGFLAAAIGLCMVFKPITVVADVIPILGDIIGMGFALAAFGIAAVTSLMTIAVGWVFFRPLVGIPLVVLSIGILVGLIVMAKGKKSAASDAPAGGEGEPAPAA